jgi:hypothetical protein
MPVKSIGGELKFLNPTKKVQGACCRSLNWTKFSRCLRTNKRQSVVFADSTWSQIRISRVDHQDGYVILLHVTFIILRPAYLTMIDQNWWFNIFQES